MTSSLVVAHLTITDADIHFGVTGVLEVSTTDKAVLIFISASA